MSKKEEFAEARPIARSRRLANTGPRHRVELRQATPMLIRTLAGSAAIRFPPPINYQLRSLDNFSEGGLTARCTKSHQIALNRSDFARRCGLSAFQAISKEFKALQRNSKLNFASRLLPSASTFDSTVQHRTGYGFDGHET